MSVKVATYITKTLKEGDPLDPRTVDHRGKAAVPRLGDQARGVHRARGELDHLKDVASVEGQVRHLPGGHELRHAGGFGVYDAPEPWGPWTAVYHTDNWDTGPGESASFPTQWISPNGLTLHLVFSGNDSFSVRKATLQLGTK